MIHLHKRYLPEDQTKQIRDWVRDPRGQAFTRWLANRAAALTAEAGNKLLEGDEATHLEADRFADQAKFYLEAHQIMLNTIDPDFKFEVADLASAPVTTL